MKYFVEQLDKRHTVHYLWRYRLRIQVNFDLNRSHYRNFHVLRSWMIEQYGVSCERDLYGSTAISCKGYEPFNPPWCWHVDKGYPNHQYIYVKDDTVLSNVTLKWIV